MLFSMGIKILQVHMTVLRKSNSILFCHKKTSVHFVLSQGLLRRNKTNHPKCFRDKAKEVFNPSFPWGISHGAICKWSFAVVFGRQLYANNPERVTSYSRGRTSPRIIGVDIKIPEVEFWNSMKNSAEGILSGC